MDERETWREEWYINDEFTIDTVKAD